MNKLPVQDAGSLGIRREQPDHKCDFQLEIKGKPERNGKARIKAQVRVRQRLTVQNSTDGISKGRKNEL